ncbi:MAG: trypsin-like serine protease [Nitrososphaerales archaeon]
MKRRISVVLVALTVTLLLAIPAAAITFGTFDGDRHPNVGMLAVQADGKFEAVCSGTLIAPKVFLTASHCLSWLPGAGIGFDQVYVSFDPTWDQTSVMYHGTGVLNPLYPGPRSDMQDVAVVLLDEAPAGITPASLPTAGLLDQMKAEKTLKDQRFVAVGYGLLRNDKTRGPHSLVDNYDRFFVEQGFLSLQPYAIQLSMNPSTGNGGTCYGDSGGPHFIGDSNVIAAITITGDVNCRATDVDYRLDTDSARAFLGQYVSLP